MPTSLVSTGVQFPDSTIQTTAGGAAAPAGTLLYISGTTTPSGYLLCDGATYSQATYPALYARLGNIVNAGTSYTAYGNLGGVSLQSVTYVAQNGKYYTGYYGSMWDSSDGGATWNANSYTGSPQNLYGMTYGNGLYVSVGTNSTYITSTSGNSGTWTQRSYLTGVGVNAWSGAFANGVFIHASSGFVVTSSDGITWTKRTLTFSPGVYQGGGQVDSIVYGAGKWVAFSSQGPLYSTDNGVTWAGTSLGSMNRGTYGAGQFVGFNASAGVSGIWTSLDGVSWTYRSTNITNIGTNCQGLTYVNGRFFACFNSGGTAAYSNDALTWYSINPGANGNMSGVAGGGANIVFVSSISGGVNVGYGNPYTYNPSTQFVVPTQLLGNVATGNMSLYIKATSS